jgi:hypothetical protein
LWIGNIEIHVNSSEWEQHGHQHDKNYENVILHVVWEDDFKRIPTIAVIELNQLVPSYLIKKYSDWTWKKTLIPCSDEINNVHSSLIQPFLKWLTHQRFSRRADQVMEKVKALGMDWQEAFWQAVSRSFGYKVNAEAFENIAASIPYKTILKLRSQLVQLEALLLGQAGLLRPDTGDPYARHLFNEYGFLKKKYGLAKTYSPVHFLRMRPINFPTIRLAQLANLVYQMPDLFQIVKERQDPSQLRAKLKVEASQYWETHYRFNESSPLQKKIIGDQWIDSLLVNTVLPFILAYNQHMGNMQKAEAAMLWLTQLHRENNNIVRAFENAGVSAMNMCDSQGLLELHKQFCSMSRCSQCAIGRLLLKRIPAISVIET